MALYHRFQCAILSAIALTACAPTSPSSSRALKIGTLLPITGDLSQFGGSMQKSAKLLVDQANTCGGVLGQPIQHIAEDDQTQPTTGAAAMAKLVEIDQVGAVVGAASSAVTSASIDIAVRNQVVQISPSSTSPIFTARAQNGDFQGFWFRTAPPDTFQGQAIATLAHRQGFRTVSILAINNDYGNGLIDSFVPAFKALGGTVNPSQIAKYTPDSVTFDSVVNQGFRRDVDAVLLISYPETGSAILKTAYQLGHLGSKTNVIATDGLKNADLANLVGKNDQGDYLVAGLQGTAPHSGGKPFEDFRNSFKTAYGSEPTIFDPNTYDAMAVIALATEQAQSAKGVDIQKTIRTVTNSPGQVVTDICEGLSLIRTGTDINYQGSSGTIDFNQDGDVIGQYDVWQINPQGELSIIDQIEVSQADHTNS